MIGGFVQVCHCGHDKATHWEERHNCLGMLCECRCYVDRDDPDRPERTNKPITYPTINEDFGFDDLLKTPLLPPAPSPWPWP